MTDRPIPYTPTLAGMAARGPSICLGDRVTCAASTGEHTVTGLRTLASGSRRATLDDGRLDVDCSTLTALDAHAVGDRVHHDVLGPCTVRAVGVALGQRLYSVLPDGMDTHALATGARLRRP